MYELIKKDGRAKRGRLTTVHGVIETPVFMNVGTVAAIKGAVSTDDLKDIGTQVYPLGPPNPYRFWRISGVFIGEAS